MKKFICVILLLCMVLSMCACGSKEKATETAKAETTPVPEYVYKSSFTNLFSKTKDSYEARIFTDNGVYATGRIVVGTNAPEDAVIQYFGQYDICENGIFFIDYSGKVKKLSNYKPIELPEAEEGMFDYSGDTYISTMSLSENNTLLVMENQYMSWVDTDEFSQDDEQYYDNYHFQMRYNVRELSDDGTELSHVEIVPENENDYYYSPIIIKDKAGNFILTKSLEDGSSSIVAIGKEGSEAYEIKPEDSAYINNITQLSDGSVYVLVWGNTYELRKLDLETKKFLEGVKVPDDVYNLYAGGGDYPLYYTSGVNFYGLNIETGETTKLFSWLDCDINPDSAYNLGVGTDGKIRTLMSSYDNAEMNYSVDLAEINKVPYDPSVQKTELTFATHYLDWDVRDAIISFNRKNDKVRIVIKDYSELNTEDDYSAGLTKMNTEIIAGNVPDIIDLSGLPKTEFASKGILEDLYPYFDKTFKRSDYLENVLKASEYDGKLYSTLSYFYFKTCVGAEAFVGDGESWNFKDINNAFRDMSSDEATIFDISATRDTVLEECLSTDMRNYVNWSTGEVKFDSEQFTNLLEFASQFPEKYSYEEWTIEDDSSSRISQGRQMLYSGTIGSTDALVGIEASFGSKTPVNFIGYPTSSGSGNTIQPNFGFAMTTACKDKDAAWEFLQQFFTEKYYKNYYSYNGFSPIKSVFEKSLKELETIDYEVGEDGKYIEDEDGNRIPKEHYYAVGSNYFTYINVNSNLIEAFKNAVMSCDKVSDNDDAVISTVKEEAQAFFAGQKSAKDVAKLVQSKINIYINEKR